jgi:O-succinylbenzoic acid--CoA ligase
VDGRLTLVPASQVTLDMVEAALEGIQPLAVLPEGPSAVVDAARAVLRADEPLEDGTDLAVLTSGSTGAGRAALLARAAVRASVAATSARLGGPGAWLLALPVSSMAGLQVLCRSVLAGCAPTVRDPDECLASAAARMPAGGRRYTALVPTQLRRSLDTEADADALRSFDAVLVGGAATDPALRARAEAAGVRVVATYGMTETAGGCVYDGLPLDGVQVRLHGGGVELSGPVLALGYRLDPAATAEAFEGGWFRTRDAGEIVDGRLVVTGRLDEVVVTGGVNVSPQAVEARLREHPDVVDAVVFGRPDDEWGTRVVAAVVPVPGSAPALPGLRAWVAEQLGRPAAPRELHLIDTVPTLHTGKPDRGAVARAVRG